MYASTEQRSRERIQVLADQLYRERYGRLLAIVRRNADNEADATEALHDAFASFIDVIPSRASAPEQLVAQVDEARAKLAALKPQELRALGLLAAGYSYAEIGELNRWTYTKVNRCLSEGRAALRAGPAH